MIVEVRELNKQNKKSKSELEIIKKQAGLEHKNKIIIVSVLDNLVKGASGQAVQNMNVAYQLKETLGLQ